MSNFILPPGILVIGLTGKIGVGKDYLINNYLVKAVNLPYTVLSFADHFKLDVIVKDKIARDRVYVNKDNESRVKLQKRGTEEGRNIYGADIWVEYLYHTILNLIPRGIKVFFISDVRFSNEVNFVERNNGYIIRIKAEQRNYNKMKAEVERENKDNNDLAEQIKKISSHPSETCLDNETFYYTIDNDLGNEDKSKEAVTYAIQHILTSFASQ